MQAGALPLAAARGQPPLAPGRSQIIAARAARCSGPRGPAESEVFRGPSVCLYVNREHYSPASRGAAPVPAIAPPPARDTGPVAGGFAPFAIAVARAAFMREAALV
jgi:hypothetical protein